MGYRYNDNQPDPRYFDFAGAFFGGREQAKQDQRRDQLTQIEQGQYDMQRQNFELQRKQLEAQGQQQAQSKEVYRRLFQEVGLDPALADTEGADELAAHILEQSMKPAPEPELMMGPDGRMVRKVEGAMGYIAPRADRELSAPSNQREYEYYKNLSPEEQAAYLNVKRASATPQSAEDIARAKAEGRAVGDAAGDRQAKQPMLASLGYVIGEVDKQIDETPTGGPLGVAGRVGGLVDYQDASRFDNLREQLSTELRAIFRIPGEGTLSDWEQKQYGLQLPDRKYEAKNNRKILTDIQARAEARITGQAPNATNQPTRPGQQTSGPPASALKEGVVTTFKNGQSWKLENGKPVQVK